MQHHEDCVIQPAVFSEKNKLSFLEGSVVNWVTRHRHPAGGGAEDIRKAIHELHMLLELVYDESP